jgi:flavodoxin
VLRRRSFELVVGGVGARCGNPLSDVLVVYFSRTGHAQRVAEHITRTIGADLEPIRESRNRVGLLGYWRSASEALRKTTIEIAPPEYRAADYRVVVLGTPVWASNLSSPMRSYLAANRKHLKRIALFCTQGGSGGQKVLAQLHAACGIVPTATLIVNDRELDSVAGSERMRSFLGQLGPG